MKHANVTLDDKYALEEGDVFLTGIQALVRLPLDQRRADAAAGLSTAGFISGYRGSPLGGYDQQLRRAGKFLTAHDIILKEGLNEDLGATAVWGSQMSGLRSPTTVDGVFGIWYGKAPGVDRTGDVFKHANFAGVGRRGGVVALAGDDPMCKSSTLPSQSEFAFADAEIPVLNPASIQEVLDYGLAALALSRFSGLWTGLIALADTMDAGAVVRVSADQRRFVLPADVARPPGGLHIRAGDTPMDKERRLRLYKLPAAQAFARANRLDQVILEPKSGRARTGLIVTGQASRDVFEALDAMGITPEAAANAGVAIYKVGMSWPLETEGVRAFCAGLDTVLVVEHKRAFIEPQIKDALYHLAQRDRPIVIGKTDKTGAPLLPSIGAIPIPTLARVLAEVLPSGLKTDQTAAYFARLDTAQAAADALDPAQMRAPHYCSGCPHNTSTTQLPEGSRALAGIGCHYMATWISPDTDFASQMGGEGISWVGESPFSDDKHVFVNLGDGTYSHSGSLAIRAAVAADVNITYKILYNDAVAMTGGQAPDAPLTPERIIRQVLGEGVARCVVVTEDLARYAEYNLPAGVGVRHRDDLQAVQEELRETSGVTVLLYDQMCATERRRRRKRGQIAQEPRRLFVNPEVCEGCGDCSDQSKCLSIEPLETELGRKRRINQSTCNQDFSCVKGFCPSFVTVTGWKNPAAGREPLTINAETIPTPPQPAIDGVADILFTGVGGTGVTTVCAILGMAAHIDGRASSTLDMTGLAQKGGAVLSHLRIAREPEAIRSGRIPPASADVLIACDTVVANAPDAAALLSASRTEAVTNWAVSPTAEFVFNRDTVFDGGGLRRRLTHLVADQSGIDADALGLHLIGDAIFANMILTGYAWQRGLIPISARAIYRAIKLNGVAVGDNQTAFDLGRLAAHDPAAVAEMLPAPPAPPASPRTQDLDVLIAKRQTRLTAYQNADYAARYRAIVDRVRAVDTDFDRQEALTRAVAHNLAKLMAYKDEYEVARLYTDGTFKAALRAEFAGDLKVQYHLAPPLIAPKDRRTNEPKKIRFGAWMTPAFHLLRRLKGLRGTAFDPFGWTEERRMERRLITDYIAGVDRLLAELSGENYALAVRIAELPDLIRGFGHVKARGVDAAQALGEKLWAQWPSGDVAAVKSPKTRIVEPLPAE